MSDMLTFIAHNWFYFGVWGVVIIVLGAIVERYVIKPIFLWMSAVLALLTSVVRLLQELVRREQDGILR